MTGDTVWSLVSTWQGSDSWSSAPPQKCFVEVVKHRQLAAFRERRLPTVTWDCFLQSTEGLRSKAEAFPGDGEIKPGSPLWPDTFLRTLFLTPISGRTYGAPHSCCVCV